MIYSTQHTFMPLRWIRKALLVTIVASAATAAENPSVVMKTSGSCSPAVADVKGNVTITCHGVTPDALKKLEKVPALLEQLIRNSDRTELIARLDALIGAVEPAPTDSFLIYGFHLAQSATKVDSTSFPYADIKKSASYNEFRRLLTQIPDPYTQEDDIVIFRMRDEKVLGPDNVVDVASSGNLAVMIVPRALLAEFGGDQHLAFTYLKSQLENLPSKQKR